MFDADHKFVTLPSGTRIHYVDEGTGETLLFLHGNPAWSFQWRDLIGGLRSRFRCVALDYPGFGLSSAPEGYGYTPREQGRAVEEFVDRLGLHDVTLVMQDWGGPFGLGLAGRRPELVRRVVLGNTWAWPTGTMGPLGLFSKIAGGLIGEFVQMNFNGFVVFALKQGVVRELPEDITEMYVRPFRPLDRRGVAAFYPGEITAAVDRLKHRSQSLVSLALGDIDRPLTLCILQCPPCSQFDQTSRDIDRRTTVRGLVQANSDVPPGRQQWTNSACSDTRSRTRDSEPAQNQRAEMKKAPRDRSLGAFSFPS